MASNVTKAIIKKIVDGNIQDIYPKTSSAMVDVDGDTLDNKLSSIDSRLDNFPSNSTEANHVLWQSGFAVINGKLCMIREVDDNGDSV